MSEERSAKLKLKRKKCVTTPQGGQEMEVKLQPSSVLSLRQDFTGSWFDEIELTAAEQTWKQVLSSVYPDLNCVGWGAVPSLPDINLKMNKKETETINTDVFKVGDMNFQWIPLPSALNIDQAPQPCVPETKNSQQNNEHIRKSLADTLAENVQQKQSKVLLTKQVGISLCSKDSKRTNEELPTPQNDSTKSTMLPPVSQKSTTVSVTKSQTVLKSFSKNGSVSQIRKGSSKSAKDPQMSQKGSTKHAKEQQISQKSNINLWATVTSLKSTKIIQDHKGIKEPKTEEKPHPNDVIMVDAAKEETSQGSSRGHTIEEIAGKPADATSSLDTCPICLMQFPKQFSQLDMDSHLAQCLSETTVDVVW
ncbi:Fanconi anemia core complex-associated protein 20 [Hyla sarda]|uniref:Fanconi anemia core complex-associated protein 20 n=1 Tax=Hyla sarda TaxID=327740 RepID=UPI0024C21D55|nr:Fanconi anemia core complex-associated protein 20 [Hyla sarda]